MRNPIRLAAVLAALALVLAACGGTADSAGDLPTDPAGACLAGDPDCADVPGDDPMGEPGDDDEPSAGGGVLGAPIVGGGLSVEDALAGGVDGVIAVRGFLVEDADGARLCDLLAESLPPQCGGAWIELSETSTIDPDEMKSVQGVTWTDFPVTVLGSIVDGVFVVDTLSK